jgi:hypothetical protein
MMDAAIETGSFAKEPTATTTTTTTTVLQSEPN